MIGIPHRHWALLVGGPEAGSVVRIKPGQEQILVREEVDVVAMVYCPMDVVPQSTGARTGIYRRVGRSDNFKWEGWS